MRRQEFVRYIKVLPKYLWALMAFFAIVGFSNSKLWLGDLIVVAGIVYVFITTQVETEAPGWTGRRYIQRGERSWFVAIALFIGLVAGWVLGISI